MRIKRCGLFISSENPLFAASPDSIGADFVVEIRWYGPIVHGALFFKNGVASERCYNQLQWQMFVFKKEQGFLVVADPEFERNKKIQIISGAFDRSKAINMAEIAWKFYEDVVFETL